MSFAEHFVRNHEIAEEIVEDFFCHLWDNCQAFHQYFLKGISLRSIHNRCLNYLRDQKIRQQYIADNKYCFLDDEILGYAGQDEEPVSNLITSDLEKEISDAIDSLPEQCRAIFRMNRFESLTYTEIADRLDISINTVKTQMTRALQKLRDGLKDYLAL
jgi:RNA polymerase sigma-70 factor (ECF subfamily)